VRADAHPEIPRKWRWHPRIDGRRVRDMRVYTKWLGMFSRCYNKNGKNYRYYGGRGIKVCERWHNFQNFLADMGHPLFSEELPLGDKRRTSAEQAKHQAISICWQDALFATMVRFYRYKTDHALSKNLCV